MWQKAEELIHALETVMPIESIDLMGSFTTKKRRPADVDFIVIVRTPAKHRQEEWALDFVIAPDNTHGEEVVTDAKKWMKQKYGARKSGYFRLKGRQRKAERTR